MAFTIAATVLPDPQFYVITPVPIAEFHVGYDGTVLTDTRAGQPDFVYTVKLRWEVLTEAEKDQLVYVWYQLNINDTVTYDDGMNLAGTAAKIPPDFRFQKDGVIKGDGSLLWNVFLVMTVWKS